MFQQTVVTVSNADQPSDTIRWGETVNQENSKTVETDMTGDHKGDNEESSYERESEDTMEYADIVKPINTLPDNHYAWGYQDPTKAYYVFSPEDKVNKGRLHQLVRYADTRHGRDQSYTVPNGLLQRTYHGHR
jgi:hypothetical protein